MGYEVDQTRALATPGGLAAPSGSPLREMRESAGDILSGLSSRAGTLCRGDSLAHFAYSAMARSMDSAQSGRCARAVSVRCKHFT